MRTSWVVIGIAALACMISIAACTAAVLESCRLERTIKRMELPRKHR